MPETTQEGHSATVGVPIIILLVVAITVISTTTLSGASLVNTDNETTSGVGPSGCLPPTITAVSTLSAASINTETITIQGSCFGANPQVDAKSDGSVTTQPSTTTPSLLIYDESQGWSAGFGGDVIGIRIASWNDSTIQIDGLGNQVGPTSGAQEFTILPGDSITLFVSGPGCTALGWPTIGVPPSTPWPASCTGSTTTSVGP